MPTVSVVTTLFYSEPYIHDFYRRIMQAIRATGLEYEFVFVDDGSPDDASERVLELAEQDNKVRLIELSRNFGHHQAIMMGLEHVTGDYTFLIDVDLEEDPALLKRFYDEMAAQPDLDVVYGVMKNRKGGFFERASGRLFFLLINLLSDVAVPADILIARIMNRRYVKNLVRFSEEHLYLGGLLQLAGFRQKGIPVVKADKGSTTYTPGRKFRQALDAIISFSEKSLIFTSLLGITIFFAALLYVIHLVISVIFFQEYLEGWVSTMASIWLMGGLILSANGLIGLYVSKLYIQAKGRPRAIIRRTYGFGEDAPQ